MRAADDFATIRARMEELRHEQDRPARQNKVERSGMQIIEKGSSGLDMPSTLAKSVKRRALSSYG
jgi:hypothetical protein